MDSELGGNVERERRHGRALRERMAVIAENIAATEDKLADILEQLVTQSGDPGGTRRERIESARRYGQHEREEAARLRSEPDVLAPTRPSESDPPSGSAPR